jgi:hypothetical protein
MYTKLFTPPVRRKKKKRGVFVKTLTNNVVYGVAGGSAFFIRLEKMLST